MAICLCFTTSICLERTYHHPEWDCTLRHNVLCTKEYLNACSTKMLLPPNCKALYLLTIVTTKVYQLSDYRIAYDTYFTCHTSKFAALHRSGATQICAERHGRLFMVRQILCIPTDQLVVVRLRNMLSCCRSALDVYSQEISFQYGISYGKFELRIWYAGCSVCIQRAG